MPVTPIDDLYVNAWRLERAAEEKRSVAFTPFGAFLWDQYGLTVYRYDETGKIHDVKPDANLYWLGQLREAIMNLEADERPLVRE